MNDMIVPGGAGRKLTMKDVAVLKEMLFTIGWVATSVIGYMIVHMALPSEEKMDQIEAEMNRRERKLDELFKEAEDHRRVIELQEEAKTLTWRES